MHVSVVLRLLPEPLAGGELKGEAEIVGENVTLTVRSAEELRSALVDFARNRKQTGAKG